MSTTTASRATLPRHTHDCKACKFLGQFGEYDLYFCDQDGFGSTVVARWSSDGPDYTSGLHSGNPALIEAEVRALELMAGSATGGAA
jgi:hypothetical protein